MYADNELLFPPHVIPILASSKGERWKALVEHVASLPQDHPESLAFSLLMIRLDGCMGCETDSYRAMRGCAPCALQTLRRYKGPDEDLFQSYRKALRDIQSYLEAVPSERVERELVPARAA